MANEIVPGLYVGDLGDCQSWPRRDRHLNVLEKPCERGAWLPFFAGQGQATQEGLDRIVAWLDKKLREVEPVLVHCASGIERSPLVVTYYLSRTMGLEAAWKLVSEKRPQAQDRRHWLP